MHYKILKEKENAEVYNHAYCNIGSINVVNIIIFLEPLQPSDMSIVDVGTTWIVANITKPDEECEFDYYVLRANTTGSVRSENTTANTSIEFAILNVTGLNPGATYNVASYVVSNNIFSDSYSLPNRITTSKFTRLYCYPHICNMI